MCRSSINDGNYYLRRLALTTSFKIHCIYISLAWKIKYFEEITFLISVQGFQNSQP